MSANQIESYSVLVHSDVMTKVENYRQRLYGNQSRAGGYLQDEMQQNEHALLSTEMLMEALVRTKRPCIFAESAINGDGSDWNQQELSILGDVGFAVSVEVFDDGRHVNPIVHQHPFRAELLFIPGALLRSNSIEEPADWEEVVIDGFIDFEAYYQLYKRRLLPLLKYVDSKVSRSERKALITVPGLGCGQFAGKFQGTLGVLFGRVLHRLLVELGDALPNIRAVYFDAYNEGIPSREKIHDVDFMIRPLALAPDGWPQLCRPSSYDPSFEGCDLYSVVAWDHVSWPGNDFYGGVRATDDGVKAAATDVIASLTGIKGSYDPLSFQYLPPEKSSTWEEVVRSERLKLQVADRLQVYS